MEFDDRKQSCQILNVVSSEWNVVSISHYFTTIEFWKGVAVNEMWVRKRIKVVSFELNVVGSRKKITLNLTGILEIVVRNAKCSGYLNVDLEFDDRKQSFLSDFKCSEFWIKCSEYLSLLHYNWILMKFLKEMWLKKTNKGSEL